MKKFLATLLALALLCVSFAVAESATLIGTMYAVGVSADGENWMDPSTLGMEMVFNFMDDGSFELIQNGETAGAGTYVEAENGVTLTVDGDSMTMTVNEANELIGDFGGIYVKLSMNPNAVEKVETPANVAAASADEFNGTYQATIIDAYGMTIDMATIASTGELDAILGDMSDLSMKIDNGAVTAFGSTQNFAFADGALVLILEGVEGLDQKIELTETGVVYTLMGMNIYFDKAE